MVEVNIWVDVFKTFPLNFISGAFYYRQDWIWFSCPLIYLLKVIDQIILEILTVWSTENSKVSSVNSLQSLLSWAVKSLIYIRNKHGQRMELWRTPKQISPQEENWPFKIIICFWLLKNLSKMINILTFLCNLKINPSCQTLSNAFEMSRNIPLTSSQISNALKISWLIDRS